MIRIYINRALDILERKKNLLKHLFLWLHGRPFNPKWSFIFKCDWLNTSRIFISNIPDIKRAANVQEKVWDDEWMKVTDNGCLSRCARHFSVSTWCRTTEIKILVNAIFYFLPSQRQIQEAVLLFTAAPFARVRERDDYVRWCNPPPCTIIPGQSRRTWFAINLAN